MIGGLPGGRPVDDVALLLARTRALPRTRLATWEIPADPSAVGEARRTAARLLREWGLEELGFSTELIVSELVTNAIRHASGPIGLRMIRAGELICEVSDASSTTPHLRHARTTDEGAAGCSSSPATPSGGAPATPPKERSSGPNCRSAPPPGPPRRPTSARSSKTSTTRRTSRARRGGEDGEPGPEEPPEADRPGHSRTADAALPAPGARFLPACLCPRLVAP